MKAILTVASCAVLLAAFAAPAQAKTFAEKKYDGCATKSEMFGHMQSFGLKPRKIVKVVPGSYVFIRAKELKTGDWYDYVYLPCQRMVDGRFPVD